jgi:hypothetical protein
MFTTGAGSILPREGGVLGSGESPEETFNVRLSLATDAATWRSVASGGRDVLIASMGAKKFDVKAEGDAAFFIRHLESIVEAASLYAALVSG